MSNPFAILADYPEDGPAVPTREKVRREKNKHEPGTGRRDKEKRQGRGQSNWGNALDDAKRPELSENQEGDEQAQEAAEPKVVYVPATNFFDSDEDDEEAATAGVPTTASKKRIAKVPQEFASMIVEKDDVKIVPTQTYSDDEDEEGIQTGFLNSQEARQQREQQRQQRGGPRGGRGGPRGGRGGPRGGPRGGRGGPRAVGGQRPERKEGEQTAPAATPAPANEGERKPRTPRNSKPLRDSTPGNVQHQRDHSSRGMRPQQRNQLSMNNFPSLH